MLNDLPGDALQCGQEQQLFSKPPWRVLLPMVGIVLQADEHLETHVLNAYLVTQPFGIWVKKHSYLQVSTLVVINLDFLKWWN